MKRNVLVLGAGLVARPLVRYLLERGFGVTVATRTVRKAEELVEGHPDGQAVGYDLTADPEGLEPLLRGCDLAVSLVPYTHHVKVARVSLAQGKPLITTSYVSNEMRELAPEAERRGVLLLNEIGLDPGIDHMSAMRIIDQVRTRGGRVTGFMSYCGGLPAPEANDNPWGYKFSWSPRGVLLAGRNPARFLRLGKVVEVEPADLFATNWPLPVEGVGTLEAYPNRNSLQYLGLYGLHDVDTMFRGTLRYPGWCRMMKTLVDLGWLDLQPPPREVETLGQLTAFLLRRQVAAMTAEEIRQGVAARFQLPPDGDTIQRLEWAGLFSDTRLATHDTILDALAEVLKEKLVYQPRERDMIALLHQFDAVDARGKKLAISSTLVDFGVPGGDSAMARTVSLPAAIAARLILEGGIRTAGVKIPVEPEIYGPVLDELARVGIVCKEDWKDA